MIAAASMASPRRWCRWLAVMTAWALFAACKDDVSMTVAAPACGYAESSFSWSGHYPERMDVLFVIDDSPSMAQEAALLRREIPRMVDVLTTGRNPEDPNSGWRPAESLHIGFVSGDLGVGRTSPAPASCTEHGAAAALRPAACDTTHPSFLWYFAGYHDLPKTDAAVRCIASAFDQTGCGVQQPLETALQALWQHREDASGDEKIGFPTGAPTRTAEPNQAFLRTGAKHGRLSRVVIVIITDKDDCSLSGVDGQVMSPEQCALGPTRLQAIEHYTAGLRALNPDDEQWVQFVLVAGIPPELLRGDASRGPTGRGIDFQSRDQRTAFYDNILDDPRMQATPKPSPAEPGMLALEPSCTSAEATAYPPRRLVQFARDFGADAIVESICAPDYIARVLTKIFGPQGQLSPKNCLPERAGGRDADGKAACTMTWELPRELDPELPFTPHACTDRPGMLQAPRGDEPKQTPAGNAICEVNQVAVLTNADAAVRGGSGFYVLDNRTKYCPEGHRTLLFTELPEVPAGVTLRMRCTDDTSSDGDAGCPETD